MEVQQGQGSSWQNSLPQKDHHEANSFHQLCESNPTSPWYNNTLAANLMARAWNSSPELQTVTTIGAAKSVARKWAQNLLLGT